MAASRTLRMTRLVNMWIAAAVVFVVSIAETAAQPKVGEATVQPKTILLLHTFGPNFEQGAAWSREIRNEMNRQSPWPLNIQEQSLVTALEGDDAAEAKFVQYLGSLYARRAPDLIVALGAPAANFVQEHRTNLYPTTPMLLAAVELRRVAQSMLSEHDAVAGVRFDPVALVENILRLLPETKAIAVIIGSSTNERFWAAELRRILGPLLENKVQLMFYDDQPLGEILKGVATLPPHSAILYQQLGVDGAGAVYGDKVPLRRIHEVANAPIFSFDQSYFNGEIVGGPMLSPTEGARPTAAAAVRMLGGEKGSDIKVPPIGFSAPKYDWRQLQRWNISESRLPPGSEILFRETTVWERYSWQITSIVTVLLIQAVLISILLQEHRRRQFAEVQSRQRMTELAHVNRFATAGELTASIAHEINQPLGSILANAETAEAILKSQRPDIAELPDIIELKDIVNDILHDDRRATEVIQRMRSLLKKAPFEQQQFDLNEVVQETIRFFSSLAVGRKFELASVITPDALPILGDRIQLQQVILNLVMNGVDAMRDTPSENRIISIRTSRVENFAQLRVGSRLGHSRRQIKGCLRTVFHQQGRGHGHGTVHRAHYYRGAQWADLGKKSGSRRRVV